MKITYIPLAGRLVRAGVKLLFVFALCSLSTIGLKSQSLFDMAVTLDSLYDKAKGDDKAVAKDFFVELKKLYAVDGRVDEAAIQNDFFGNQYMAEKVNIVYAELGLANDDQSVQIGDLLRQQDSLFNSAILRAESACNDKGSAREGSNRTPCNIQAEIGKLKEDLSLDNLRALRQKASENKGLNAALRRIELKLFEIARALEENRNNTETVFQLSQVAAGGAPFGGNAATNQAFTPIVLQQQGGGSLQSNIIDGASKWIAERMREELSIAFFDRFENWVTDQKVDLLFPSTFSALESSVTTDYSLMIQIFKTAFEKDLKSLPFSVGSFLSLELNHTAALDTMDREIQTLFETLERSEFESAQKEKELTQLSTRYEELLTAYYDDDNPSSTLLANLENTDYELNAAIEQYNEDVQSALFNITSQLAAKENEASEVFKVLKYVLFSIGALERLSQGQHPSTLLSYLNHHVDDHFPQAGNIKPALLVMDVISRSLIRVDQENNTVWLKGEDLARLSREPQLRQFYFGLIYQEIIQSINRDRLAIEAEKQSVVNEQLVFSEAGQRAEEYMFNVREAVNLSLYINDVYIIDNFMGEPTEMVADSIIIEDNLDDPAEIQEAVKYALRIYHKGLEEARPKIDSVYNANIAYGYTEDRYGAMDILYNELDSVYRKYGLAHFDEDFGHIDYVLDLYLPLGAGVGYIEGTDYQADIQTGLKGWFDARTYPSVALAEINAHIEDATGPIIADKTYRDQLFAIIDPIKTKSVERFYLEKARPDSAAIVQEALQEIPEITALNLRLHRLDKHQSFINNLLLGHDRSFGDLINNFSQFADRIDFIQAQFAELKANGNANVGAPEFVYLLKNSLDVLQQVYEIALPGDNETLSTIKSLTNNVLDAYAGVLEKDYNAILMNIIPVANGLVEMNFEEQISLAGSDSLKVEALHAERLDKLRKLQDIFRYGAFLAAVAGSQNSDDIKSAIRAIALPSGSYSIKRRAFSNVSLNAYPGLTGGAEYISNSLGNDLAPNFGFTAPIGLAFSWGYKSKVKPARYESDFGYRARVDKSPYIDRETFLSGHSGSLFFPLIDLGALVLFRLGDSDNPLPEDVGFQQIFAPGIMYTHGFANVPISIMGGMQISPQLRKLGEEKANSFRINLSIVVDLPMANFHTRSGPKF